MRMRILSASVLALLVCLANSSRGDEEEVPLDKIPAPVLAAAKAKFPAIKVKEATKETEDGKTVFELESTVKGQNITLSISDKGKLLEIEEEISLKDLPAAVAAALHAKYPKAEFPTVEKVTDLEDDDSISYAIEVKEGNKKPFPVALSPKGKFLEVDDD